MKRNLTVLFFLILSFVLQNTVFKCIALGNVTPNLILIVTSCYGFMRGKREGMVVGFWGGIMVDVFFGGGIIGIYALLYMLIGYLNGYFNRGFYPEDIIFPLVFVAISDFVFGIVTYIVLFALRGRLDIGLYFTKVILPEAVYTVVVTLIVYRLFLRVNMLLEHDEKKKEAKFV